MPNSPKELVERVRQRLKALMILREILRYAVYSAIIALFPCLLSKFVHPLNKWQIPAGIILAGIIAGLITALVKKVTSFDAAMVADLRGNTGETLTTYLEMQNLESDFHPMIETHADAASKGLTSAQILPFRFPRSAKLLLPVILLITGSFFIPEFKYPKQKQRELNIAELADAAKKCWQAIRAKNLRLFGEATREAFEAQTALFPRMLDGNVPAIVREYSDSAYGWKLSGAGGGGYLILVTDREIPGAIRITIRRPGME